MTIFGCSLLAVNACVSMNNQERKVRSEIVNVNSNEPLFYLYSIKINKCRAIVIVLMTQMLNYVFLMLLKTQMTKYLI